MTRVDRIYVGIPDAVSGLWLQPRRERDQEFLELRTTPGELALLDRQRALDLADELRAWAGDGPPSIHFTPPLTADAPACGHYPEDVTSPLTATADVELVTCRNCRRTVAYALAMSAGRLREATDDDEAPRDNWAAS